MKKELLPSDFICHPYESVFYKTEAELVAMNIMIILKRTGNKWRKLRFEEYEKERKKDGGLDCFEDMYFLRVVKYTTSAAKAKTFSPAWKQIGKGL